MAQQRGHRLELPKRDLVHGVVLRQSGPCVIRPQDDRPHSRGRRLRLHLRRGRVLRRTKPVLRDLLQAEIVGRPLRGPRRPVEKVLLRPERRLSGVVLRPLGQAALRAEHLDAEFPQLSQGRILLEDDLSVVVGEDLQRITLSDV